MVGLYWSLIVISLQIFMAQCQDDDSPTPTLKPANPFLVDEDVQVIKDEIKNNYNLFRDDDKFINIWFHRTYSQRSEIINHFSDEHELSKPLVHKPFGGLSRLYNASFYSPARVLARAIDDVFNGDYYEPVGEIEEIVCGNDKAMKDAISKEYKSINPESSLEGDLSNFRVIRDKDYNNVMTTCWNGLCQDKRITPEEAEKEANDLRNIFKTDKDGFMKKLNESLSKYCEPDMRMIFQKYRFDPNHGINNDVQKAIPKKRQILMRAWDYLVRYLEDKFTYYADELDKALRLDESDRKLNRIVLTRCETDLGTILKHYENKYPTQPFLERIGKDPSTDPYRKSIGYLCGEK